MIRESKQIADRLWDDKKCRYPNTGPWERVDGLLTCGEANWFPQQVGER